MSDSVGNSDLTRANIKEEIILALGGSSIDVELEEGDIEKVIKDTIRVYNRHRPARGHDSLAVTTAQKKYLIDKPNVQGIVQVQFVEESVISGDPFDPFYYHNVLGTGGDTFGEYDQKRQYIEQSRRIGSSEPEWQQRAEDGKVYLYIDTAIPYKVSYTYTYHYTPNNDADTGMQKIPQGDVDWFMQYAAAQAKLMVGRKRSKFGGIILPEGSTAETDGGVMKDEAKEEITKLEEQIARRRRPLLPEIE